MAAEKRPGWAWQQRSGPAAHAHVGTIHVRASTSKVAAPVIYFYFFACTTKKSFPARALSSLVKPLPTMVKKIYVTYNEVSCQSFSLKAPPSAFARRPSSEARHSRREANDCRMIVDQLLLSESVSEVGIWRIHHGSFPPRVE